MTRERKLAIEMWENIADLIRAGEIICCDDVDAYKESWCNTHNLNWGGTCCYLCRYFPCKKCPLHKKYGACTNKNNPYYQLRNHWKPYEDEEGESFADMAECIAEVMK